MTIGDVNRDHSPMLLRGGCSSRKCEEVDEFVVNYVEEVEAAKKLIPNQAASINYHKRHLTIVHPSVRRERETNTDPMVFWLAGVQGGTEPLPASHSGTRSNSL